jgi:hypothetical protein
MCVPLQWRAIQHQHQERHQHQLAQFLNININININFNPLGAIEFLDGQHGRAGGVTQGLDHPHLCVRECMCV